MISLISQCLFVFLFECILRDLCSFHDTANETILGTAAGIHDPSIFVEKIIPLCQFC